jgi:methanogenic corrinoid protein MtbC1
VTTTRLDPLDDRVERFLEHVVRGDPRPAIDLAVRQLADDGPSAVVTDLLAVVQREVGERWHGGRYTVAQEHLVSGVVDDVLGLLAPHTLRPGGGGRSLALVCAEGEWHSTPARMAGLLARDAGWQVRFLGGSTPPDHLATTLAELQPDALAVSCTLPLALPGVPPVIDVGRALGLPVVAGGRAFDAEGSRAATLGADASFGDIRDAVAMLGREPAGRTPVPRPAPDDAVAAQRDLLGDRHQRIVDAAYAELERRLPIMAGFDDRRRHHTRQDLDYLLRFADVALFAADVRIFTEFVGWLTGLLEVRGIPRDVMVATLEAVAASLGEDLPAVHELLDTTASAVAAGGIEAPTSG